MANRRDSDDMKLGKIDEDDIIDVNDAELKDLERDLDSLGDDDLHDDILDEEFEEVAPRPRARPPRKTRKPVSILTLVLLILLVVVGGTFALMNNTTVLRAFMFGDEQVAQQKPATVASVYPPPGNDPAAPQAVPAPALPSEPLQAPTTPSAVPDVSAPGAVPAPTTSSGPGTEFSDLPQPDVIPNQGAAINAPTSVPAAVATAPDATPPAASISNSGSADTQVPPPIAMGDKENSAPVTAEASPEPTPAPEPAKKTTAKSEKKAAKEKTSKTTKAKSPDSADTAAVPAPPSGDLLDGPQANVNPPISGGNMPPSLPVDNAAGMGEDLSLAGPEEGGMAGMDGGFYESTKPVQETSARREPRLELSRDQVENGLGVEVSRKTATSNQNAKIEEGNRALELDRYQAALDIFDDLYKNNKHDERIMMGRAVALQKLGRNEEAIKAYDQILALSPDSPEVVSNMVGLVRQQYPSAALQRLLDLRQRYPNNPTVAAQTGLANAGVGNLEEGLRYLGIAAGLEPNNPKHFFNMGVIAERMGKPDLAIAYYEKALQADALNDRPANKLDRDLVYDRLSYLRQGASSSSR